MIMMKACESLSAVERQEQIERHVLDRSCR